MIETPQTADASPGERRITRRLAGLAHGGVTEPIGPFATHLAGAYITIAFLLAAPVYPLRPLFWTLAVGLPVGALLLAPKAHLKRVVLDGPAMMMVAWIGMSVLWTRNPEFGLFSVRRDLPLVIAASLVSSLVPKEVVIKAIQRGLMIGVAITVFALVFFPETRTHAADGVYALPYPGWNGFFIHKNVMAPYLILALITTLIWEKEPTRRGLMLAVIGVLLIGSDSATGLSTALFVGAMWAWFRFFHRSKGRWSTAYVMSSLAVALCAIMVAVASLSALANAYGKDLTFSGRTFIWQAVISAIQDNPWVGYGVGGVFWDPRSEITRQIWRDVGFAIPHSHSGALDVWLNFGIVGLAIFSLVFVSTVFRGTRLLRSSPELGEWILLILAAQFLMSLSENVFLGSWLVYIAVIRGVAQRELNDLARVATPPADQSAAEPEPRSSLGPLSVRRD